MASPTNILAESKLRQQRLFEHLTGSPIVEVLGVVSPAGVSAGKFHGEELWTFRFTFEAWRIFGALRKDSKAKLHKTEIAHNPAEDERHSHNYGPRKTEEKEPLVGSQSHTQASRTDQDWQEKGQLLGRPHYR